MRRLAGARGTAAVLATAVVALGLLPLPMLRSASAQGVRYVDDDPGCGGKQPCYASIQSAADSAASGEAILVAPGRYTETVVVADKSLAFDGPGVVGDESAQAVWVGRDGTGPGIALLVDAASADLANVRVTGLRFVSATAGVMLLGHHAGDPIPAAGHLPAADTLVRDAVVKGNAFADCGGEPAPGLPGAGIVAMSSDGLLVESNAAVSGDSGLVVWRGRRLSVRGNQFSGQSGPSVRLLLPGDGTTLSGNVVRASDRGIEVASSHGGYEAGGSHLVLAANDVAETHAEGVLISAAEGGQLDDVRLSGNTIRDSGLRSPRAGVVLRGGTGALSDVHWSGGDISGCGRPGVSQSTCLWAESIAGGLAVTDTVVTGATGTALLLVDVQSYTMRRSRVTGNREGIRIVEREIPPTDSGSIRIGGATKDGNVLGGNVRAALVLDNQSGAQASTRDVDASHNDWGTAYEPAIQARITDRADDPSLGRVTVLPALAAARSVTVAAVPPRLVADGASTSVLTAIVRDLADNPVADDTLVEWETTLGSLARPGGAAEAEGPDVVRSNGWVRRGDGPYGQPSDGAYVESSTAGASVTWGFDAPALLARFGQSPTAQGTFTVTVDGRTVGVVSTAGAELAWAEALLARDLGPGSHTVTLTVGSGDVALDVLVAGTTTVGGTALNSLRAGTQLGTALVTAAAHGANGTFLGTTAVPLTVGPAAAVRLRSESPVLPIGGITTGIVARVVDALDRPVTDGTPVRFSTTLGSVAPADTTTDSGLAHAVLTSGMSLGTATVVAATGTITGVATIDLVAGPPATITLRAAPMTIPANSVAASELTAEIVDRWGNPVVDDTAVSFSTSLGGFDRNPALTAGGVARTRLVAGAQAGVALVRASAPPVQAQTAITLTALDARVTKHVEPQSVVVPGEWVTYTLAYGNVGSGTIYDLVIDDPVPAGLAWPRIAAEGPPLEQITGRPPLAFRVRRVRPGETGVITVSLRVDPRRPWGNRTAVTNTVAVGSPRAAELAPADNRGTASIVVVPGSAFTVTVRAPERLPVGGAIGVVTATVTDRYGNPAADGTTIAFSVDLGDVAPDSGRTSGGIVTTTYTSGTRSGVATVRALASDGRGGFDQIRLQPGSPTALSLDVAPGWLVVGGATMAVTATVRDRYDNLAGGAQVAFEADRGTMEPGFGRTGVRGYVTNTLRSGEQSGTATVVARSGALSAEAPVSVRPGPVAEVVVDAAAGVAAVGRPLWLTALARDRYRNPVAGARVLFSTNNGVMDPPTAASAPDGRAASRLWPARIGVAIVSALADGVLGTARVDVPGSALYLPFTSRPQR